MLTRFNLQLHIIVWPTAESAGPTPAPVARDFDVLFDEDARINDLVEYLARESSVAQLVDAASGDLGLFLTLKHAAPQVKVRLPPGAPIRSCGLTTGTALELRRPQGEADLLVETRPLIQLETWSSAERDGLFLVEDSGPNKGRVTHLLPGRIVSVGGAPPGDGWPVYLDDGRAPAEAFRLHVQSTSADSGDHRASLTPASDVLVRINGEAVTTATTVWPGSTLQVSVLPPPHKVEPLTDANTAARDLLFSVTTHEGLEGRNPFGRVRFEPVARRPLLTFPRLAPDRDALPDEPRKPEPIEIHWENIVVPLSLSGVMVFFGSWYFILFGLSQPIVYGIGLWRERRARDKRSAHERREWEARHSEVLQEFGIRVAEESAKRRADTPDVEEWLLRAYRRLPGLWERRATDRDFLVVRLGTGDLRSGLLDGLKRNSRGRHLDPTEQRLARDALMPDVPTTVNLTKHNAAILGSQDQVRELATSIILQAACAHSPGSLAIAALLPKDRQLSGPWSWLKWLPHFQSASALLPPRPLAVGRRDTTRLLESVLALVRERTGQNQLQDVGHVLILAHEASEVDASLLAEIQEISQGFVHVLWLGSGRPPSFVDTTITLEHERGMGVIEARDPAHEWKDLPFTYQGVSDHLALRVSRALAPLYDPRSASESLAIPEQCALSSVVDFSSNTRPGGVKEQLAVPLGMKEDGVFSLDLVADGPHILVGGTTGAGKSELLQTLAASLVATYDASEVNLFLVDFKGGSTFADFQDLPHISGFVSDLEPAGVRRALAFLRAELRRRMHLFARTRTADGGVVPDYPTYCETEAAERHPLPRLVIIFDEFATLVTEHADLRIMDQVTDVAQRGRSLGVHLVLATQQPSGEVVTSKVKANVSARIGLRTQDSTNSEIILDSPEAALIPRSLPGRAFARLEGTRLVQFQTAWSGAEEEQARQNAGRTSVLVRPFEFRLSVGGTG